MCISQHFLRTLQFFEFTQMSVETGSSEQKRSNVRDNLLLRAPTSNHQNKKSGALLAPCANSTELVLQKINSENHGKTPCKNAWPCKQWVRTKTLFSLFAPETPTNELSQMVYFFLFLDIKDCGKSRARVGGLVLAWMERNMAESNNGSKLFAIGWFFFARVCGRAMKRNGSSNTALWIAQNSFLASKNNRLKLLSLTFRLLLQRNKQLYF